ncbi:putative ankyrin repeat-containing protein-like [Capsicum annuum]|nr:putative ankyrin repeat-containing protein-like [Capsicum annuum]
MDSILYKAAMEGNTGDSDFLLAEYLTRDEENGYQVTPKGNTVLHIAALYGQSGFVRQVIDITPSLLCCQNKKNETALHLAANKGNKDMVEVLLRSIDVAGQAVGINKETLMRMTDDGGVGFIVDERSGNGKMKNSAYPIILWKITGGDTALHKAMRTGCVETVRLLVAQDPDFEFPANNAGETPLYLAAESGLVNCFSEILEHCNRPTYSGPYGRTALDAAIIQKHMDCATSLWEWNKSLCEETDKWGWNPLHYAVKQGLRVAVRKMLGWKTSLAYTHAGNGNDWATSIHIAANPDNDGNTPLHLLAATYRISVSVKLRRHVSTKKMLFNKENQTSLDISVSSTERTQLVKWSFKWNLGHCRLGRRDFEIKWKKIQKPEDETESRENTAKKDIMEATRIHLVVATLLVTVTFAAGYTLPGGFESDLNSSTKGMAILIRETAFRAFVVSDDIAFTCSACAVFCYFFIVATCERRYNAGGQWNLDSVTCGRRLGTQFQYRLGAGDVTVLNRFTIEKAPEVPEAEAKPGFSLRSSEAWKHSDFLCRNYILSGLQDDLYNVYSVTKTTKELWGALERKYKTEDAGTKKFFVARFLEYKMIDNKSVVS